MKTFVLASLFAVSSLTYAQSAREGDRAVQPREPAATPQSCDDLVGMEKEACLKKGGTVKSNTAGSGATRSPSAATPAERKAAPDAKKDSARPDAK